jgi:hypothetical protein
VRLGQDEVRVRLDDPAVDVDALIAEHDADRPARQLGGWAASLVLVQSGRETP